MKLEGYRGLARNALEKAGVDVGDLVRIKREGEVYEGILMPRAGGDRRHIVVKLASGYCIGIRLSPDVKVEKIGAGAKPAFKAPPLPEKKPGLPKVSIISTGGTIAARVEYRTGAVHPALSASDLYAVVPELADLAEVDAEILFSIFSENMTPAYWKSIAGSIYRHLERKVDGVVVAHGTDTMAYTAAALSFALQNLPVPIILVGAQRSSDRPSSDAAVNLVGAVRAAARAPFAEVGLVMHDSTSDEAVIIHRGTKVRKCHTSRRDTFKSINAPPLAKVEADGRVVMLAADYRIRDRSRKPVLKPDFNGRVALVKFYPGFDSSIIDWYVEQGYCGIVLEGTGLGHVGQYCFGSVKRAIDEGLLVCMTSQCLWGRVNMKVYDTGRDLLALGVIPLEDMLPETALVKMMWAFGQTKDRDRAKEIMLTNIAGEISARTEADEFF